MATSAAKTDFDAAYRAHYGDVHRFVFHFVQDASIADDLTQEAFLKAYQAWDSFRGDAPQRIWLLRIARNVCLDYVRSPRSRTDRTASIEEGQEAGREPGGDSASLAGKEPPPSVEQAASQAEMTGCVQEFILSLPETLRTPLILHDVEGLTNKEIAEVLGCKLEAAKMRLHRARTKLREMMDDNCDLFHDERNVFSCLPVAPDRVKVASGDVIALEEIRAP